MTAMLAHRVRADAPLLLVTTAVLVVTALAVAVTAQLIAGMTAAGLADAMARATPAERGLTVRRPTSGEKLTVAHAQADGEQLRADLPRSVRAVTGAPATIVDSPRMQFVDPVLTGRTRRVTLRTQPGYEDHVRVVEGRLPRPSSDRIATPANLRGGPPARQPEMAVIEMALSRPTARALRIVPGDVVVVDGDLDDPYAGRAVGRSPFLALRVVGLVHPDDVARPFWFGDRTVHTPTEIPVAGGGSVTAYATALTAPDALPELATAIAPLPLVPTSRIPVDPDRVDSGTLSELRPALRRMEQRYVASPFVPEHEIGIATSLGDVLDRFEAARGTIIRTMAVTGVGCAGVGVTVIALLVALRARVRCRSRRLLRARGASTRQVLAIDLMELVPACVLAAAAAAFATPASMTRPVVGGTLAAVMVTVLLALSGARDRDPAGRGPAADPPVGRRSTVEAAIVVAAIVGVLIAQRRGVVTSSGDLLLVAVPTLVVVAAGVLLVRLLPAIARRLLALGSGDRSVTVVTGLQRIVRRPAAATWPVLAVTAATATVVLTAAAAQAVDRAVDREAWFEIGAPAVVDTTDAVDGGSPAFVRPRVRVAGADATVIAVEPGTYADLVAGTPIATDLGPLHATGTPLPAIAAPSFGAVGTVVDLSLPGLAVVPIEVRAVRERMAGVSADMPFVMVPLPALAEVVGGGLTPNRWYLDDDVVREGSRTQAGAAAALGAAPLPAAGRSVLRVGAALAAGLGILAASIALVLATRDRRRDLTYLRAVGLDRRQAMELTLVEALPPLVAAVLVGVVAGTGLTVALADGLRLDALAGGAPVVVRPDAALTGLCALALLAPIAVAAVAAAWRGLDRDLASALRTEQPW